MNNTENLLKVSRILSIFKRLNNGAIIKKAIEAKRFNVNKKTIQRDIEDIRDYLAETQKDGDNCELIYSHTKKGYIMTNSSERCFKGPEILAIVKVLLESRAFCHQELDLLFNKLLLQVSPLEKQQIQEVIRNEKFHYAPVRHNKLLINNLWTLSQAMKEQWLVKICYKKENEAQSFIRVVEPQGIIFSEYYFYLIACIYDANYDFPAVYRVDRIQEIEILDKHYAVSYCNRFQEGEFRKCVQFMNSGPLLRVRFKYWGESIEAVMDRLPTARVLGCEGNVYSLEAEVFGKGIKMWFLSQAQYLEVVGPEEFREEMRKTVKEMARFYEDEN